MPLEPLSDARWTAFLYVLGELAPERESAFERRLAEDQSAREAVAEAVELAGALTMVPPPVIPIRPRPRGRVVWAMLAAACLAAAALATLRRATPDASEVAVAWSDLRTVERGAGDGDWLAGAEVPPAAGAVVPAPPAEPEPDASPERTLPSWLLTAASVPTDPDHSREN